MHVGPKILIFNPFRKKCLLVEYSRTGFENKSKTLISLAYRNYFYCLNLFSASPGVHKGYECFSEPSFILDLLLTPQTASPARRVPLFNCNKISIEKKFAFQVI